MCVNVCVCECVCVFKCVCVCEIVCITYLAVADRHAECEGSGGRLGVSLGEQQGLVLLLVHGRGLWLF